MGEREAALCGGVSLGAGDEPGRDHVVHHLVGAVGRGVGIARRVEPARRPDQPGDHGALEQGQPGGRFVEIALGGGIDPVTSGTEIDAVQIDFEDLVLGEAVFEPQRQQHLAHLAREGPVRAQEQVLGELLRDRAAALENLAGAEISRGSTQNADRIEAEMAAEPVVLRRDDGVGQVGRHFAQGQRLAEQIAGTADQAVIRRQDRDARPALGHGKLIGVRQGQREIAEHAAADDQPPQQQQH